MKWCIALFSLINILGTVAKATAAEEPLVETPVAETPVAETPFAVSHLLNDQGEIVENPQVYQSEPVRLVVDIYSPTWFAKAPSVDDLSVAGALLVRLEKFATNFSQNRDGHRYSVQRREYTLFPQRSGRFVIPSTEVRIDVAQPGSQQSTTHRLRTNPLLFQAQPLPDNPSLNNTSKSTPNAYAQRIFSATQVDLAQRIIKAPRQLRSGDAIQRQITLRAQGALGMLLPELRWPELRGMQQQSQQQSQLSRVEDSYNRGTLVGSRTITRNYTFTRPGHFTLPELHVHWWNPQLQQWQQQTLAAHDVVVAAAADAITPKNNAAQEAIANFTEHFQQMNTATQLLCVLGALLLTLLLLTLPLLRQRLRNWSAKTHNSEYAHYLQLRFSIRYKSAVSIRQRYYAWHACIEHRWQQSTNMDLDALLAELYGMPESERPSPQLRARLRQCISRERIYQQGIDQQNKAVPKSTITGSINPW